MNELILYVIERDGEMLHPVSSDNDYDVFHSRAEAEEWAEEGDDVIEYVRRSTTPTLASAGNEPVKDTRPIHYVPERLGMRSICAASLNSPNFGTWTADARNITCAVCAAMLIDKLHHLAVSPASERDIEWTVMFDIRELTNIPSSPFVGREVAEKRLAGLIVYPGNRANLRLVWRAKAITIPASSWQDGPAPVQALS